MKRIVFASLTLVTGILLVQTTEARSRSFGFATRVGAYSPATFGDGESIPNRSMTTLPMAVSVGYRFSKFQVGLSGEYALSWQTTDPAEVSDQNAEGRFMALGLEGQWLGKKWGVSLGYRGLSEYEFAMRSSSGQRIRYQGQGFSLILMRSIRKSWGFYLEASSDSFDKSNGLTLSPEVRMVRYSLGLVLSNFWN